MSPRFIVLCIAGVIGFSFGTAVYFKYSSIVNELKNKTIEISRLNNSLAECKVTNNQFVLSIEEQNRAVDSLNSATRELEQKVKLSDERIASLRRQRDKALKQISSIPVPVQCDKKFDWMIERAQELAR